MTIFGTSRVSFYKEVIQLIHSGDSLYEGHVLLCIAHIGEKFTLKFRSTSWFQNIRELKSYKGAK